jgi:hypothetical protein
VDEETALGLDERGEAPPPYGADKPLPMISRTSLVQPEAEMATETRTATGNGGGHGRQNMTAHRLPDYDQVANLEDGIGAVTRPPVAVRPMERVAFDNSDGQDRQRERARIGTVDWEAR